MRTTVTLDPDVARVLQAAMRERGVSFKQALNDAIRAGLMPESSRGKRRFVQRAYSHKALAAAEAIEDQELSRRLTLRG